MFVYACIDSRFKDHALKDLSSYLQNERKRLDESIKLSEPDAVKDAHVTEKNILIIEEKILYDLVKYLQEVGFLETNKKTSSGETAVTINNFPCR